jgi:hypothetical protein
MINLLIAHIYLSKLVDYVGECLETGSELLLIYMKGYNWLRTPTIEWKIYLLFLYFSLGVASNLAFFISIFTSLRLYVIQRRLGWSIDPKINLGITPPWWGPSCETRSRWCWRTSSPLRTRGLSGSTHGSTQRNMFLLLGRRLPDPKPQTVRVVTESLSSGTPLLRLTSASTHRNLNPMFFLSFVFSI